MQCAQTWNERPAELCQFDNPQLWPVNPSVQPEMFTQALHMGLTAPEMLLGQKGFFLVVCIQPTLFCMSQHHHMQVLGNWYSGPKRLKCRMFLQDSPLGFICERWGYSHLVFCLLEHSLPSCSTAPNLVSIWKYGRFFSTKDFNLWILEMKVGWKFLCLLDVISVSKAYR